VTARVKIKKNWESRGGVYKEGNLFPSKWSRFKKTREGKTALDKKLAGGKGGKSMKNWKKVPQKYKRVLPIHEKGGVQKKAESNQAS